jgi:hypothetical protein
MYNLLNKILSLFHLKLVSTKPDTRLVKESVKFLNTLSPEDLSNDKFFPPYVGDIVYFQKQVKGEFPQVSGETYVLQRGTEDKYYDYVGDTFTSQQLQEKLNNE